MVSTFQITGDVVMGLFQNNQPTLTAANQFCGVRNEGCVRKWFGDREKKYIACTERKRTHGIVLVRVNKVSRHQSSLPEDTGRGLIENQQNERKEAGKRRTCRKATAVKMSVIGDTHVLSYSGRVYVFCFSTVESRNKMAASVEKDNFVISESIQFAPLRTLNEFALDARFEVPQYNDMKKFKNRVITNLLYFQTNYFILFFTLFLILSAFQSQNVLLGFTATAVTAAVFFFSFTPYEQVKQFRASHPYATLAIIALSGYYAITQLPYVLSLLFAVMFPGLLVFLHASLRLRNLGAKVNFHLENAKLRNTVMATLLDTVGLRNME
ncbi:PRA1 family protein [Ditylenchus destructor]|nr:PRA1 family protein [Ditylenchus destructor]